MIAADRINAAHDLSEGGLAVALAEMALAGKLGASIAQLPAGPTHAVLFGEDQGRYLLACAGGAGPRIVADAAARGVPALAIGATGGDALRLPGLEPILTDNLRTAFESALPAYMAGGMPDGFVNS